MSNLPLGNPISLDTAVANWAALGLPGKGVLWCSLIIWEAPTTIGHTFTLKNADGSTILTGVAEAGTGALGNTQKFSFSPQLQLSFTRGWFLSQISSGTLFIYV